MSQCAFDGGACVLGCDCVGLPQDIKTNTTALKGYAPDYGDECSAHDMAYGDCTGASAPDWCISSWCYVEPECALSDKTASFYFDDVSGLFYSYTNCGGADTFSDAACGAATDLTACGAMSQCAFDNGACVLGCDCISLPAGIDLKGYTATYGAQCAPHDIEIPGDCTGSDPPDWCDDSWCYVQPTCSLTKTETVYFPEVDNLFYSYANCGAQDAFTSDICGAATDSSACAAITQCQWDGVCYPIGMPKPTGYGFGYGFAQ
jgi:hypothetical protein